MIRAALVHLLLVLSTITALAQAAGDAPWPSKPIRLIVPFPAGSSTDVVARLVTQKVGPKLGQQFVIDNRAGASGNIGADLVARAVPDGYTFGIATASTHALALNFTANLSYHPIRDFEPVALIGAAPYVMVTSPGLGTGSVQDFIALAKSKPGALNYGSAGPASLAHLAALLFESAAKIHMTHVPYKSSAQSTTDLITGRLDMQFATIAPTMPFIRTGQLRALGVTGSKRSVAVPDLPTIAETGILGYEALLWMGIVAPAATPPAIVERLNSAVFEVLNSDDTKSALLKQGLDIDPGTPGVFKALIEGDMTKWRNVIQSAGIQAQ